MPRPDVLRKLYGLFDPEKAPESSYRAERPHSPIARIEELLDAQLDESQILLIGTVGTGKTTELIRLVEARQAQEFVVYLDLVRHFDEVVADLPALQRVRAWEVCFLAALAVWRAAQDVLSHKFPAELGPRLLGAWRDVHGASGEAKFEGGKLEIGTLVKSMFVAASSVLDGGASLGLKVLAGAAEATRWSLPIGGGTVLPDQRNELQTLLACVNEVLGEVQRIYRRRVLLVIDGLDRLTNLDHIRALFRESGLLARFICPTVLCGPNLRQGMQAAQIRRFRVEVLVNEPVLAHANPAEHGPGIAFFRDVFHRRASRVTDEPLIDDEQLGTLAYYSGGQVRTFVRLVRSMFERAILAKAAQITTAHVEAAIDEQRALLEMGLHRGHIDLLRAVIDDPEHRLPNDERVWDLLANLRLLPYPNESEWYYPHPLLTRSLLRARTSGASA